MCGGAPRPFAELPSPQRTFTDEQARTAQDVSCTGFRGLHPSNHK